MSLPKEGYIPFNIDKKTYQLLCELEEGDVIQWHPPIGKESHDATIIEFYYDRLGYRIKANSSNYDRPILIELNWVKINNEILRDIKLNRVLNGNG